MSRSFLPALALLTLTLAACGQPTTSPVPDAVFPAVSAATTGIVTLSIPAPSRLSAQYVNQLHTTQVDLQIDGGPVTKYTLGSPQAPCTNRLCTISLGVLSPASHTFAVDTYGVRPSDSTTVMISQGSVTQAFTAGQNTNVTLTLTPVNVSLTLSSAVKQYDKDNKTFGNYVTFSTLGGRSLPAYYDVQNIDSVGDAIPPSAAINAVICGSDSSVVITNISDAAHPNRFRVEVQSVGAHTLSVQTGTTCVVGGAVLATQAVTGTAPAVGSGFNRATIGGGSQHSAALLADGTVRTWGNNGYGQLGNGGTTNSNVPVTVSGLSNVVTLAAPGFHTLALLNNGTVRAWGGNNFGQLGNGSNSDSNVPVTVSNLSNVVSVSGGVIHSIALLANGTVRTWGYNPFGQLGNGNNIDSNVPVTVTGLSDVVAVTGAFYGSMALLADGTVRTWGYNLGDGSNTSSNVPVTVSGLSNVAGIGMGSGHSLAVLTDGTVRTWGNNTYGQLGTGNNTNSTTPVTVGGLSGVISVAAGDYHSLALLTDGTVRTWGSNNNGQLGNGSIISSNVPVIVSGLANVNSISGGLFHSMALLADGTVRTWGNNSYGQLGNGSNTSSYVPVTVSGLSGVAQPSPLLPPLQPSPLLFPPLLPVP